MLRAHEINSPKLEHRPRYWWFVTKPDGSTFHMRASEWLMAEYYGKAGWPYKQTRMNVAE